jgi:hypothetical protein
MIDLINPSIQQSHYPVKITEKLLVEEAPGCLCRNRVPRLAYLPVDLWEEAVEVWAYSA